MGHSFRREALCQGNQRGDCHSGHGGRHRGGGGGKGHVDGNSHGGDREVGQGRGEVSRALCFCYVKDSAEVTKEVVVMVVMKDAT